MCLVISFCVLCFLSSTHTRTRIQEKLVAEEFFFSLQHPITDGSRFFWWFQENRFFSGNGDSASKLLLRLKLHFMLDTKLDSDKKKILFAATCFQSGAFVWFERWLGNVKIEDVARPWLSSSKISSMSLRILLTRPLLVFHCMIWSLYPPVAWMLPLLLLLCLTLLLFVWMTLRRLWLLHLLLNFPQPCDLLWCKVSPRHWLELLPPLASMKLLLHSISHPKLLSLTSMPVLLKLNHQLGKCLLNWQLRMLDPTLLHDVCGAHLPASLHFSQSCRKLIEPVV